MSETSDAQILAVSAPVLLPIIRRRQEQTLNRLIGAYRSGEADLRSIVAEYAAHSDLIREIERILATQERGE